MAVFLRRNHLAGSINREMRNLRDGPIIGQYEDIDIHEAVPLVLIIGGDPAARRQIHADPRRRQMLDAAGNVDPRPEGDIAVYDEIAGAQDQRRVDQSLLELRIHA